MACADEQFQADRITAYWMRSYLGNELNTSCIVESVVVFMEKYERLRFSAEFQSKKGLELLDDNFVVRSPITKSHSGHTRYIFADLDGDQCLINFNGERNRNGKGCYCWRINVYNPRQYMIVFGVAELQHFERGLMWHSSKVWGICPYNGTCYPSGNPHASILSQHDPDLNRFNETQCQIDMFLDTLRMELIFHLVGTQRRVTLNHPPDGNIHQFVPYFNLHRHCHGAQLRLATIPVSWFGKRNESMSNVDKLR